MVFSATQRNGSTFCMYSMVSMSCWYISNAAMPHRHRTWDISHNRMSWWHKRLQGSNSSHWIPRFSAGNNHPNLTHLPLVPPICVVESGQHWFRWRLGADYLKQCWVIVNCTLMNLKCFSHCKYFRCVALRKITIPRGIMVFNATQRNGSTFCTALHSARIQWYQCPVDIFQMQLCHIDTEHETFLTTECHGDIINDSRDRILLIEFHAFPQVIITQI